MLCFNNIIIYKYSCFNAIYVQLKCISFLHQTEMQGQKYMCMEIIPALSILLCKSILYPIVSWSKTQYCQEFQCHQFWSLYKSITMTLTGIFLVPIDGTRLSGHNSLWTSVLWEWEVPVHVSCPSLLSVTCNVPS